MLPFYFGLAGLDLSALEIAAFAAVSVTSPHQPSSYSITTFVARDKRPDKSVRKDVCKVLSTQREDTSPKNRGEDAGYVRSEPQVGMISHMQHSVDRNRSPLSGPPKYFSTTHLSRVKGIRALFDPPRKAEIPRSSSPNSCSSDITLTPFPLHHALFQDHSTVCLNRGLCSTICWPRDHNNQIGAPRDAPCPVSSAGPLIHHAICKLWLTNPQIHLSSINFEVGQVISKECIESTGYYEYGHGGVTGTSPINMCTITDTEQSCCRAQDGALLCHICLQKDDRVNSPERNGCEENGVPDVVVCFQVARFQKPVLARGLNSSPLLTTSFRLRNDAFNLWLRHQELRRVIEQTSDAEFYISTREIIQSDKGMATSNNNITEGDIPMDSQCLNDRPNDSRYLRRLPKLLLRS
jgi:hypothetical protein